MFLQADHSLHQTSSAPALVWGFSAAALHVAWKMSAIKKKHEEKQTNFIKTWWQLVTIILNSQEPETEEICHLEAKCVSITQLTQECFMGNLWEKFTWTTYSKDARGGHRGD